MCRNHLVMFYHIIIASRSAKKSLLCLQKSFRPPEPLPGLCRWTPLFATFAAREQLYSSVYSHMTVQLPCCPKPFPAFTAFKWFFSFVYFRVASQGSSLIKMLTTFAARKWL